MSKVPPSTPWEKRVLMAGAEAVVFRPKRNSLSGNDCISAAPQHQSSIPDMGELIACESVPKDYHFHVPLYEPGTFDPHYSTYRSHEMIRLIEEKFFAVGDSFLLPRSLMIAGIMYLVIKEAEDGKLKKVLMVDISKKDRADLIADPTTLLKMAINKGQQLTTQDNINYDPNTRYECSVFFVSPTKKIDYYGQCCFKDAFFYQGIDLSQDERRRRPVSMSREEQQLKWYDLDFLHFPVLDRAYLFSFKFSVDGTARAELARTYALKVKNPVQMLLEAQNICQRNSIQQNLIRSGRLYAFATDPKNNNVVSAMQMAFNKPYGFYRQWNSHEVAISLVHQRRIQLESQGLLPPNLTWSLMFFSDFGLHGFRPSYQFNSVGVSGDIEKENPLSCGSRYHEIFGQAGPIILSSPWLPVADVATKLPFHTPQPAAGTQPRLVGM